MILLITYDLNSPGQDYGKLYAEIKKTITYGYKGT